MSSFEKMLDQMKHEDPERYKLVSDRAKLLDCSLSLTVYIIDLEEEFIALTGDHRREADLRLSAFNDSK